MRFPPPSSRLVLLTGSLLGLACAKAGVIAGAAGSGGSNSDASSVTINLDAPSVILSSDAPIIRVNSDAPPGPNCGNGEKTKDEACDDGNTVSGDGCANNCLYVEPGYSCVTAGKPCRPIARCGDGLAVFPEQCDDGNKKNGDGCSDACRVEVGWKCAGSPSSCTHTTCGDGKIEGAESCEDGNNMPFDGCSADCTNEPKCKDTSGCTSTCGDGIVMGNEACDDGNNTDGDGCSADCKVETGYDCTQPSIGDKMQVPAIYRDFKYQHPTDFEAGVTGSTTPTPGLVKSDLDANGRPVYTGVTGNAVHIASAATFAQWYSNVDGVNHATTGKLTLWNNDKGGYVNRYKEDGTQYFNTEPAYYCGNVGNEKTDADGKPIPCTSMYATATNCDELAAKGEEMLPGSCVSTNGSYSAKYIVSKMDGNPCFFPVDNDNFSTERNYAQIPPYYDASKSWPKQVDDAGNVIMHNFSFTSEVRYWFKFDKSKTYTLDFTGDDDVWVFINGKLAVDLGGIHSPVSGTIVIGSNGNGTTTVTSFDTQGVATTPTTSPASIGLQDGTVYQIAVFQAERQTTGSSYKLTLSGFNAAPSVCKPKCGDGVLEMGEECDDGDQNGKGGYGTCGADCTLQAGFCGDGAINGDEDCDDGALNGTAGDPCPSGCHWIIPIF
jgi:fibro-slime domain-containing protein